MILGIGTDIVPIDRIEKTLAEQGERFINRCFAPNEITDKDPTAAFCAKRWAAKEACAKALGLGICDGIYLRDIMVMNDTAGRPSLTLTGGAKERLTAITPRGMTPLTHVSLADDGGMAMAFVVISAQKEQA